MTDAMIELAKRAVACKGWRWMPGMLSDDGRVVEIHVYGFLVGYTAGVILKSGDQGWPRGWQASASLRLPDLTDPATLGCLLALVREAHAIPFLQVSVKISREHGYQFDCHPHHRGQWVDSEAEALVAALEAAL